MAGPSKSSKATNVSGTRQITTRSASRQQQQPQPQAQLSSCSSEDGSNDEGSLYQEPKKKQAKQANEDPGGEGRPRRLTAGQGGYVAGMQCISLAISPKKSVKRMYVEDEEDADVDSPITKKRKGKGKGKDKVQYTDFGRMQARILDAFQLWPPVEIESQIASIAAITQTSGHPFDNQAEAHNMRIDDIDFPQQLVSPHGSSSGTRTFNEPTQPDQTPEVNHHCEEAGSQGVLDRDRQGESDGGSGDEYRYEPEELEEEDVYEQGNQETLQQDGDRSQGLFEVEAEDKDKDKDGDEEGADEDVYGKSITTLAYLTILPIDARNKKDTRKPFSRMAIVHRVHSRQKKKTKTKRALMRTFMRDTSKTKKKALLKKLETINGRKPLRRLHSVTPLHKYCLLNGCNPLIRLTGQQIVPLFMIKKRGR
ncbi:hypothetical protein B0H17DRAFT_1203870 [Mycena rosella]|uniref:Uncharacterized protein n=1 Tax=Mycena rosella TaxID=1033263 RepID=A0AAD7DDT2_MYCRO|nr:hypothetical protein B0H17DRAFT_1203870 [Mycena rosella]